MLQPQPPSLVDPEEHTRRARHSPTAHVPSPLHGPATCSSVHGAASGKLRPPQSRVSMHCMTCMQVPALHSESALHSVVGAQYGPECAVEGVEPGGHDSGSGSTTSASAMFGANKRTMQAARVRMRAAYACPITSRRS